jgi:hypothetical protein
MSYTAQPPPAGPSYPVDLGVSTPPTIARWRPIVQGILALPHFVLLILYGIVAEVLLVVAWFACLFTGQMPEGIGGFLAGLERYAWRVQTYVNFLREDYPRFGLPSGYADPGDDPAWFAVNPPQELNRLAVLLRIILAIPQAVALYFVNIVAAVAVLIAWFAVVFTGRWPEGLRDFVVGASRWQYRFRAWFAMLADPYPPFSLS